MKEEPPFGTPDAGLVQIKSLDGKMAGMGFLVSRSLVITCAHVINAALGPNVTDSSLLSRSSEVTVAFPFAAYDNGKVAPEIAACVLRARPPGRLPSDDIALLQLRSEAPEEVGVTVLASVPGPQLAGNELDVFGAPIGTELPIHFAARFSGRTSQAWIQIDDADRRSVFVTGGFSGGRVWSYDHEAAVGMIVAKHVNPAQRIAFMIPAKSIVDFLEEAPHEVRRNGPSFPRTWTITASLLFLLILTHFLGDRLMGYPSFLALGSGFPVMNAFQGLRISSIAVPVLLLMLCRFAWSYEQHPWWQKIPRFGYLRDIARPATGRVSAALSLFFFAVLPLAAQIHFFDSFVTKGQVLIEPSAFNMTGEALQASGYKCEGSYCEYEKAGRMNLVEAADNASARYFDNAYHYGELGPSRSVTFFPILEPSLYAGLLATSIVLFLALIWQLVSRPSRFRAIYADQFNKKAKKEEGPHENAAKTL